MATESPAPKEATPEALLGLKSKLIERTSPLPDPFVYEDVGQVHIEWGSKDGKGFSGGKVNLHFAKEIEEGGGAFITGDEPKFVVSHFEVNKWFTPERKYGARESLAAFLTMVATINEAAKKLGEPLLHVARANPKSLSYFERLREAGLYHYCDWEGNPSPHRCVAKQFTLFACEYPIKGLDEIVGKFAVPEAVDLLAEMKKAAPN